MRKRIGEFPATYPSGTPETIVIFQEFHVHRSGRQTEEPGSKCLETANGQHVNQITKGQYQIVENGRRLASKHADAV